MPPSIQLRGGFETSDPRLDRLPQFDERSRNFPVTAVVAPKSPRSRSYTSRLWLDQGQEGACVGFSWHHNVGTSPKSSRGLTNDLARQRYFEAQQIDEWPGGAYPGASPFYEGTSVLCGAKVMQSHGYIEAYQWAFSIDEVILALGYEGPVVFGIPWLDSMFRPGGDGLLDCSGKEAGGHAICGRGVVLPRRGVATVSFPGSIERKIKTDVPLIRLRNSWGPDWGLSGEALVRADDMERLLKTWGECCVPVGRKVVK